MLSSALIDPSDEDALDKLEAEVERVRKEGGLGEKEGSTQEGEREQDASS